MNRFSDRLSFNDQLKVTVGRQNQKPVRKLEQLARDLELIRDSHGLDVSDRWATVLDQRDKYRPYAHSLRTVDVYAGQ